ncbi:hypothetical protein RRG08_021852 [Elysia crispata]|uniref:Uncharacterized protein n=1 Tax=Elysia crispata TaxID=231223 RepID=A0AAE0YFJ3_9GAST|nr:hypothetical protein RRG08_021852 [Elysia crispata]
MVSRGIIDNRRYDRPLIKQTPQHIADVWRAGLWLNRVFSTTVIGTYQLSDQQTVCDFPIFCIESVYSAIQTQAQGGDNCGVVTDENKESGDVFYRDV